MKYQNWSKYQGLKIKGWCYLTSKNMGVSSPSTHPQVLTYVELHIVDSNSTLVSKLHIQIKKYELLISFGSWKQQPDWSCIHHFLLCVCGGRFNFLGLPWHYSRHRHALWPFTSHWNKGTKLMLKSVFSTRDLQNCPQ